MARRETDALRAGADGFLRKPYDADDCDARNGFSLTGPFLARLAERLHMGEAANRCNRGSGVAQDPTAANSGRRFYRALAAT